MFNPHPYRTLCATVAQSAQLLHHPTFDLQQVLEFFSSPKRPSSLLLCRQ